MADCETIENASVAVLGLAFKSGTSDARKSPAIKIANILASKGSRVTAYDPEANEEASWDLVDSIKVVDSTAEALKEATIVVIATDWPEFKNIKNWLPLAPHATLVVDAMNCIDNETVAGLAVTYLGIGRY